MHAYVGARTLVWQWPAGDSDSHLTSGKEYTNCGWFLYDKLSFLFYVVFKQVGRESTSKTATSCVPTENRLASDHCNRAVAQLGNLCAAHILKYVSTISEHFGCYSSYFMFTGYAEPTFSRSFSYDISRLVFPAGQHVSTFLVLSPSYWKGTVIARACRNLSNC